MIVTCRVIAKMPFGVLVSIKGHHVGGRPEAGISVWEQHGERDCREY
jgi:hypothetical protein